ncbi:MAG: hypothetical protein IJA83_00190 [Clostridia bacterium]|nr:hypothetical protein [Clostridia bacterium]
MKKILCLVLSLMLLALCPAMAENAAEELRMQVLTSPNGDYSFEVPETYFTMDAEWVASLMEQEEFQKLLTNMMGLEDPSMLETYIQMMEASNMMIVYAADFYANLNVQAIPASLSMDMVVALKSTLDETMVQQYTALGLAEEDIGFMEIQQIGEYRWYGVQMVLAGTTLQTMITVVDDTQYTVTFTGMDEAASQHVLESFRATAPTAAE